MCNSFSHHAEASQLIFAANQLTGLYMIEALVLRLNFIQFCNFGIIHFVRSQSFFPQTNIFYVRVRIRG